MLPDNSLRSLLAWAEFWPVTEAVWSIGLAHPIATSFYHFPCNTSRSGNFFSSRKVYGGPTAPQLSATRAQFKISKCDLNNFSCALVMHVCMYLFIYLDNWVFLQLRKSRWCWHYNVFVKKDWYHNTCKQLQGHYLPSIIRTSILKGENI